MEITREEQRLLTEFRKLHPHQRQELMVTAQELVASASSHETVPVATDQCALRLFPAGSPAENNVLVTE